MHADQVPVDAGLVAALLRDQQPELADLPIRPVAEAGTDHQLYRLGDDLVVRMPIIGGAAEQAASDWRWMPRFAPHLPLQLPEPVALGEPGHGYPYPWLVVRWIAGERVSEHNLDPEPAARDLARFVTALRGLDATDAPIPVGTERGTPLARLDAPFRTTLAGLDPELGVDRAAVERVWTEAVAAPAWEGPPTWFHGDLLRGNLLARNRHLVAVIDFGTLAAGDPAPDVCPAWTVFTGAARTAYREALGVDEAMWRRAKGWTIVPAVNGIGYYRHTRPDLSALAREHIEAVLGSD